MSVGLCDDLAAEFERSDRIFSRCAEPSPSATSPGARTNPREASAVPRYSCGNRSRRRFRLDRRCAGLGVVAIRTGANGMPAAAARPLGLSARCVRGLRAPLARIRSAFLGARLRSRRRSCGRAGFECGLEPWRAVVDSDRGRVGFAAVAAGVGVVRDAVRANASGEPQRLRFHLLELGGGHPVADARE
jgi:hypothetical protein